MHRPAPWTARLWAFFLLSRPLFLAGGFLFHGLGVVMALFVGATLDLTILIWTQIAITAGQAMTHFANEYFDQAGDRLNRTPTPWSGGSRVLPADTLPGWIALAAALASAALALLAGGVLLGMRPDVAPFSAGIIGTALALSWFYSAPPLRLHSRGLGELTVAGVNQGLTPLLGFLLQTAPGSLTVHWSLLLGTVLPIACIQIPLMLGVEWPDVAADAAAGKRTLAVRLGPNGVRPVAQQPADPGLLDVGRGSLSGGAGHRGSHHAPAPPPGPVADPPGQSPGPHRPPALGRPGPGQHRPAQPDRRAGWGGVLVDRLIG